MKYCVCIFFILNSISLFCQAIYTIPNASVQPRFVFPIYFEEGNGHKDTLYLGYDSVATGMGVTNTFDDSSFGVKPVPIDTSSFYVCWTYELYKSFNPLILKDSVYKSNVSRIYASKFPGAYDIRMNNGILPLKISWDKSLFYSDSLPFISNPPAPRGQGRFAITFSNNEVEKENGTVICQFWPYILITDTTVLSFCTARDSMTISNLQSDSIPVRSGIFTFYINPWSGVNVGIERPSAQQLDSRIYPNPFIDNFTVSLNNNILYSIFVRDIFGNLVYEVINRSEDTKVFAGNLCQGVYVVELVSGNKIYRHKIIKQ